MTHSSKFKKYFWFSLLGHLFLLSSFVFYFFPHQGMKKLMPHYMATYFAPPKMINLAQPSDKIKQPEKPSIIKKAIVLEKKFTKSLPTLSKPSQNHLPSINHIIKEDQVERQVLKILHAAIAEKQFYPETALQLNQTGIVKIRFQLDPNGTVTDISLQKSSGIASIDAAAFAAVQTISPIKAAGIYLQRREYFSVDVVFE